MDAAREVAQLLQGEVRLLAGPAHQLDRARVTGLHALLRHPEVQRERHQPLLRAVVQVALDPPPLRVGGGDDPRARVLELGDPGGQGGVGVRAEEQPREPAVQPAERVQAGEEARQALRELRDLARGIHPAILTNRGLAAALDDLAARATVPVEVLARPDERLPDAVEAAAYFVVSECLANIGKHAQAGSATVSVAAADGHLEVVVADDGVGGAELASGTGMQGLVDRVGALSGTLAVDSPPGEGTRVVASIPLEQPEAADEPLPAVPRARVLSAAEAERVQGQRKQRLRIRTGAMAAIAGILVVIWALTGPDLPWIAWPLLGIGFVVALDAWRVVALPPLRESDVEGGDRTAAIARATKRRRFTHRAGGLAILNLFLVGVWIASGSAYFWPAWVMLGSIAALALKALPRPAGDAGSWHDEPA